MSSFYNYNINVNLKNVKGTPVTSLSFQPYDWTTLMLRRWCMGGGHPVVIESFLFSIPTRHIDIALLRNKKPKSWMPVTVGPHTYSWGPDPLHGPACFLGEGIYIFSSWRRKY